MGFPKPKRGYTQKAVFPPPTPLQRPSSQPQAQWPEAFSVSTAATGLGLALGYLLGGVHWAARTADRADRPPNPENKKKQKNLDRPFFSRREVGLRCSPGLRATAGARECVCVCVCAFKATKPMFWFVGSKSSKLLGGFTFSSSGVTSELGQFQLRHEGTWKAEPEASLDAPPGVAQNLRARVSQVLVFGSMHQGAILVHALEPQPNDAKWFSDFVVTFTDALRAIQNPFCTGRVSTEFWTYVNHLRISHQSFMPVSRISWAPPSDSISAKVRKVTVSVWGKIQLGPASTLFQPANLAR